MDKLQDLKRFSDELPLTDAFPALFLGHGSPMNAIEENQFVRGFREVASSLERPPKAILCISAHWFTKGTRVTAVEMPKTIHDFYGFPKSLFEVEYPAPGQPELAKEAADLLKPVAVELDYEWGLDHGAWSVIKHLYPEANIPVIQLSIDRTKPAAYHYELAKHLKTLRKKGVLIVGSGNIVHNLGMIDWKGANQDDYGFDWAREVREKVNAYLMKGDYAPLVNYEKRGIGWKYAIPTPEHYLPMLYTLALQEQGEELSLFNDKLLMGSISMTSIRVG